MKSESVSECLCLLGCAGEMEVSLLEEVENILRYRFRNKKLLEEALTHSSFLDGVSYERLEFVGDPVLSLAISNYLFLAYPDLDPGQLSALRAANVSTEKLARVAVRIGLHRFVRHSAPPLVDKVERFVDAVKLEINPVAHGGSVKAPKVLADVVESVAAAIYVDVNFDLQTLWVVLYLFIRIHHQVYVFRMLVFLSFRSPFFFHHQPNLILCLLVITFITNNIYLLRG